MFNLRSERNLREVHPDLQKLFRAVWDARGDQDFIVTEGVRTLEEQKALLARGATRTLNSRHLTGHAIDVAMLMSGKVRWDWPLYEKFAKLVKETANKQGIPITWGGDWKSLKDGPHYELPWASYPA